MTPDDAAAAVRSVIAGVAPDIDVAAIADDTALMADLDLDSVDFLNVVIGIYEQHGVEIPERDYDRLERFGDVVRYLAETPV